MAGARGRHVLAMLGRVNVFRYYALVPHAYRRVRRRFASRLPRPRSARSGKNLRCALPGTASSCLSRVKTAPPHAAPQRPGPRRMI